MALWYLAGVTQARSRNGNRVERLSYGAARYGTAWQVTCPHPSVQAMAARAVRAAHPVLQPRDGHDACPRARSNRPASVGGSG